MLQKELIRGLYLYKLDDKYNFLSKLLWVYGGAIGTSITVDFPLNWYKIGKSIWEVHSTAA